MSKHTPGPWKVYANEIAVGVRPVASEPSDVALCSDMDTSRPDEETMANARLIAAAPDLLVLLEECKQACLFDDDDGGIGVSEDAVIPADLFNRICAAIAKATGAA